METARRCFPAGCLPDIYALRIIPYPVSQEDDKNGYSNKILNNLEIKNIL
jgi:hypothetical protein